ncbi:hypothetical protein GLOIN_2v1725332 [Rhizophagus clarus]|uniref:Ion transport domain-containing protein n=1 Tax=Rhizophagus clarus TaxID=94130 RepID=A0A8H3QNX3_9GLOM|nr:hypothetical protein GLOIN_2v1725332 [Rhizophagus clarus]
MLKKEPSKLSLFAQIVRDENDDDTFDNLIMEAVVNYKWVQQEIISLEFFLDIFCSHSVCNLVGCYLGHIEATEYRQCQYYGWKYWQDLFNWVDLISVVTSLVLVSVYITPAFADVVVMSNITAGLFFTMLLLGLNSYIRKF